MWKIVSVCSIAMTCMLSSGIVCASQDSAAFIESLRDQSDMLRRQATVTGAMLALYLPFSTASYGWQGLVMLLAAVSVWQVPEQYQGRLFLLWLCSVVWLNSANGAVPVLAGMGMTLMVLCLVHEYVPASSKRLQISRWFAEGYVLHLLIIAGMVNGLQVHA